jgi:hypothetical protein
MGGNQFSAKSLDSVGVFTNYVGNSPLQVLDLSTNLIQGDIGNLTLMLQGLGSQLQEL